MYWLYLILIVGRFLSYNPTLDRVAENRQTKQVKYSIHKETDIEKYKCLVGVPYEFGYLIDKEVYFVSDNKIYGPWLVVDVEAEHHKGIMDRNNLLADTNCKDFVHKKGYLIGVYGH